METHAVMEMTAVSVTTVAVDLPATHALMSNAVSEITVHQSLIVV